MKLLILLGILTLIVALSLAIVVALFRHKKASSTGGKLLGESAEVSSDLTPEGAVVVHGELWRARSRDGSSIRVQMRVRVVGFDGHLLLVEVYE
jgi:membrane-bound serine protease (ClpP class)